MRAVHGLLAFCWAFTILIAITKVVVPSATGVTPDPFYVAWAGGLLAFAAFGWMLEHVGKAAER